MDVSPDDLLACYARNGNNAAATARELGVPVTTIKDRLARLAREGHAPGHFENGTAPGYLMGKVTVQRGPGGDVERTWERQSPDDAEREAAFRRFVEDLIEPIKGLAPLAPIPPACTDELLVVYPIGDHHHGLYADARETGEDYDCKIASGLLTSAVDHLVQGTKPAATALLLNLGDYYHADDGTNETPAHRNKLDVDTRYPLVMQSGAWALIGCVLRLLEKHDRVIVWNMPGNHDPHASFALAMAMSFYFYNEPRVEVDMGLGLYKFLRFGKNLIGSHHGHGAKAADLPLLMAADRKEDWGVTDHRVWLCGHIHHRTVKEHPGCVVETFRTLAGKDAYHADKGYRSGRDMTAITFHREHGEVERLRCDIGMLRAA